MSTAQDVIADRIRVLLLDMHAHGGVLDRPTTDADELAALRQLKADGYVEQRWPSGFPEPLRWGLTPSGWAIAEECAAEPEADGPILGSEEGDER